MRGGAAYEIAARVRRIADAIGALPHTKKVSLVERNHADVGGVTGVGVEEEVLQSVDEGEDGGAVFG